MTKMCPLLGHGWWVIMARTYIIMVQHKYLLLVETGALTNEHSQCSRWSSSDLPSLGQLYKGGMPPGVIAGLWSLIARSDCCSELESHCHKRGLRDGAVRMRRSPCASIERPHGRTISIHLWLLCWTKRKPGSYTRQTVWLSHGRCGRSYYCRAGWVSHQRGTVSPFGGRMFCLRVRSLGRSWARLKL